MLKKYISFVFLYVLGTLCWLLLFSALQSRCITNVPLLLDGLWTKELSENFVQGITGAIAFRIQNYGCGNKYIYTARYYPNGVSGEYETKTLTSIVNLNTWKEISSDTTSTTYVDAKYKYILNSTSDGVFIRIFDK